VLVVIHGHIVERPKQLLPNHDVSSKSLAEIRPDHDESFQSPGRVKTRPMIVDSIREQSFKDSAKINGLGTRGRYHSQEDMIAHAKEAGVRPAC
jgi:hypothetical protein